MLASRLVKSCLFLLVALAPVAAKAGFIIDAFNGPNAHLGSVYNLANGLTVTKTVAAVGSVSLSSNGIAMVATNNGAASGSSGVILNYTFSNTIGSVDALGGTPALRFDFGAVTGGFWSGTVRLFDSANNLIGSPFGANPLNMGANSVAAALANTRRIQINYSPVGAGAGSTMTLSTITATPEPSTLLLFGGIAGVGYIARRRSKVKNA